MRFESRLTEGRLIQRYKRFLADVALDGETVTAHCGNPGSMMGLAEPGSAIWLAPSTNPKAKLAWRWEIATQTVDGAPQRVGINTARANALAAEAIADGRIGALAGYARCRREVRYGQNSRIDLLLEDDARPPAYVEVKSVTLRRPDGPAPDAVEFPDAVTARGAKHLAELAEAARAGARAVMLFVAQRGDGARLAVAADIDPAYAEALREARAAGVETLCYDCQVTPEGIDIRDELPIAT